MHQIPHLSHLTKYRYHFSLFSFAPIPDTIFLFCLFFSDSHEGQVNWHVIKKIKLWKQSYLSAPSFSERISHITPWYICNTNIVLWHMGTYNICLLFFTNDHKLWVVFHLQNLSTCVPYCIDGPDVSPNLGGTFCTIL